MRYFISIDVDDEDVKQALVTFMNEIDGYGDTKTVHPENLHMTLLFLGERDYDETGELVKKFNDSCERVCVGEFECTVSGVGVFPHMNYIETVCAGAEPGDKLERLHMKFSECMNGENEHEFVPHITVGRVRGIDPEEKAEMREVIESYPADFGSFQVDRVRLKQSELGEDGPTYRDVEVHEL